MDKKVSPVSINNLQPAKPGDVRNPNGRTKGSKNRKTLAKKWLSVQILAENPLTGETALMTAEDLATLAIIREAMNGNVMAFRTVMDMKFGKEDVAAEIDRELTIIRQTIEATPPIKWVD